MAKIYGPDSLASIVRVTKVLPEGTDPTLLILRGHLLVEEVLYALVRAFVPKPDALRKLKFPHLAMFVESLYGGPASDWLWPIVRGVDDVRNEIAHELSDEALAKRIARMTNEMEKRLGEVGLRMEWDTNNSSHSMRLRVFFWVLVTSLETLRPRVPHAELLERIRSGGEASGV